MRLGKIEYQMYYLINQESLLFRHPGVSLLEIKASLVRGVPGDDRGNEVVALRFLDSFPVPPPGLAATSLSAPASAAASGPAQVLHVVVEPVLPERAAIHSQVPFIFVDLFLDIFPAAVTVNRLSFLNQINKFFLYFLPNF